MVLDLGEDPHLTMIRFHLAAAMRKIFSMEITMKKIIIPITVAGIWITVSEFVRNEFLLKSYWTDHFSSLGLEFNTLPLNGILWLVWSFALAYLIFKLLQKYPFIETIFLAWLSAFLMMWITLYNLQTLPVKLLLFAVPLSLLEVVIAALIISKLSKTAG